MSIENNMKKEIIRLFKTKLNRELTVEEMNKIAHPRSLMGYEAIIDTLRYEPTTLEEIENYLRLLD